MNTPIAFLDACALYPFSLRDLFMQIAVDGIIKVKWSNQVKNEVIRNVIQNNKHITKVKMKKTFELMEKAILACKAESKRKTCVDILKTKTDSKDVKILAAAIDSSCSHLITFNLSDFDVVYAFKKGVRIIHPDNFLDEVIKKNQFKAKISFQTILARRKNPTITQNEFCHFLNKNQLPKTAQILKTL